MIKKYKRVIPKECREEPFLILYNQAEKKTIKWRYRWKLLGGDWHIDRRIRPLWNKNTREKDIYEDAVELIMETSHDLRKRKKQHREYEEFIQRREEANKRGDMQVGE